MIIQRLILAVISLALMATAASITVFAAAFAVYALLRDMLTPAGAAAAVMFLAALLAAGAAFVLGRSAKAPLVKPAPKVSGRAPAPDGVDRFVNLARERPFVAAGAAVAAGLLAIANPAIVTAVLRAFIDPRSSPRR